MKKFLLTCGLALALAACTQSRASAWGWGRVSFGFNIGANFCYEGPGLCGLLCCWPGPWNCDPYCYAPTWAGAYPAPVYGGYYAAAPAYGYGAYAAAPAYGYGSYAAAPAAQPAAQGPVQQAHYTWGQTGYQATSYQPSYGHSVPSYWYGY